MRQSHPANASSGKINASPVRRICAKSSPANAAACSAADGLSRSIAEPLGCVTQAVKHIVISNGAANFIRSIRNPFVRFNFRLCIPQIPRYSAATPAAPPCAHQKRDAP
jgi:hypothetical protein